MSTENEGLYNIGLGFRSGTVFPNQLNSAVIGAFSLVNVNDKIHLESMTLTAVEGPVMYTFSDGRFKDNISERDVKGLGFIKKLRPVVYNLSTKTVTEFLTETMPDSVRTKYLDRDFIKSTAIRQSGFIAQEVEIAANEVGYDFNGLHKPVTKKDNYSLAYAQFVVPLVKAVQELSSQNIALKQTNDDQAKINESLKKDMAELREMISAQKNKNIEGSIKITESNNEAKLYQNAPNPFSKTTTIKYSLPASSKQAVITITNISGVKIKTFNLSSKSSETLNINGGELSADSYIYTLIVDNVLIDSKIMILTK